MKHKQNQYQFLNKILSYALNKINQYTGYSTALHDIYFRIFMKNKQRRNGVQLLETWFSLNIFIANKQNVFKCHIQDPFGVWGKSLVSNTKTAEFIYQQNT